MRAACISQGGAFGVQERSFEGGCRRGVSVLSEGSPGGWTLFFSVALSATVKERGFSD